MKIKIIAIIICVGLFNFSCKKEDKNDSKRKIDVSAITERDFLGNNTGTVDNTDWTADDYWISDEATLFELPSSSQLAGTKKAADINIFAYPNPVGSTVIIYFNATDVTLLQIVITDDVLSVKDRYFFTTKAGSNPLQINFDPAKYANKTNYRVYYSFYSQADGLYFKGHGDIRISR